MRVAEQQDRRMETWNSMNAGRSQKGHNGGPDQPGQEVRTTDEKQRSKRSKEQVVQLCFVFFFFLFQLSHSLRLQGQAATDLPCAHFTAQASINYQPGTLDIDRQLGCRTASANTVASEDAVGAVTGAAAEPYSSVRLTGTKWFTQNQRC